MSLIFVLKCSTQWLDNETELLKVEVEEARAAGADLSETDINERLATIQSDARRQESAAQATYGMLEGHDPNIAPIRRALAVWNMNIDDIGVASVRGQYAPNEMCLH